MEKYIASEIKKLDIEIGRKIYSISKQNNIEYTPSPLQGKIIDYLAIHSGEKINQNDLKNALGVSKATISGTLQIMEKNGIVRREIDENDARNKTIILTKKSEGLYEKVKYVFEILDKELTKNISKEELKAYYDISEKLFNNIKEKSMN